MGLKMKRDGKNWSMSVCTCAVHVVYGNFSIRSRIELLKIVLTYTEMTIFSCSKLASI